jgi:hypothetical protein
MILVGENAPVSFGLLGLLFFSRQISVSAKKYLTQKITPRFPSFPSAV